MTYRAMAEETVDWAVELFRLYTTCSWSAVRGEQNKCLLG